MVKAAFLEGVSDLRVLMSMREVPRSAFVGPGLEALADEDRPFPIGHGQVTTQPSLIAKMIEALSLTGRETVLEVGTGLGYQAALLARLAAHVWSIDLWPDLVADAWRRLARSGVFNVRLAVGDGTLGIPGHAPFDAIVVAAGFRAVPAPLIDQLAIGGRLVQPIDVGDLDEVTLFRKDPAGQLVRVRRVRQAQFVPLYGQFGFGDPIAEVARLG